MEKQPRRELRQHRLFKVEVTAEGRKKFNAIVRNISTHGLRARGEIPVGDNRVQPGQPLKIQKHGFDAVSGTVRWNSGQEFGVEFDQEIDVEQFSFGDRNTEGLLKPKDETVTVRRSLDPQIVVKRPGFSRRIKR
ncbi:PilZ domain-containing protein [Parasphingorhabdus marina]|uniref:PilZ domain-containing protein n=1 Tax=Parasphingorhabdus marina TaxID=394732 RepID=UPI000A019B14|nr:PilZ domain-containing protein [Parasphingorhabdus marina]